MPETVPVPILLTNYTQELPILGRPDFLPATMGINFKDNKPLHFGNKMNGHPILILSDHFPLDVFKKQMAMIAYNSYLYGAGCTHRNYLFNPYKHAADTDIQKISLNTRINIP